MPRQLFYSLFVLQLFLQFGCDSARQPAEIDSIKEPEPFIRVHVPGISDPQVFEAGQVDLPGDTMVLGVVVNERPRAYMIDAMEVPKGTKVILGVDESPLSRHIVNDLIDGIPVSVTFCDSTGCTAVFTDSGSLPLNLSVGGWSGKAMLLRYKRSTFSQEESAPPLQRFPHEVMAWDEWRNSHPHTEIYLGDLADRYLTAAG